MGWAKQHGDEVDAQLAEAAEAQKLSVWGRFLV